MSTSRLRTWSCPACSCPNPSLQNTQFLLNQRCMSFIMSLIKSDIGHSNLIRDIVSAQVDPGLALNAWRWNSCKWWRSEINKVTCLHKEGFARVSGGNDDGVYLQQELTLVVLSGSSVESPAPAAVGPYRSWGPAATWRTEVYLQRAPRHFL